MMAKPSLTAIRAAIAAQAPPDWQPPVRERTRRKLVEDSLEGLGDEKSERGENGAE